MLHDLHKLHNLHDASIPPVRIQSPPPLANQENIRGEDPLVAQYPTPTPTLAHVGPPNSNGNTTHRA
ncbi:hypothetical protein SPBR_09154 [Sporothrix brasiliensis 5110]|uniref:Uncharacterized protein n=1 Tax=Sporothrix brasiliensis 5110 TaxID=1398154 RepID=A0A0C2F284_9PEZI|nr:uncharacterized protein SPBR_09154 [Sporothrix brasiliensis 5110]KIH93029.1 hypothetical protein SPBR_09154 [Sporothrix brasiliensis 5110]